MGTGLCDRSAAAKEYVELGGCGVRKLTRVRHKLLKYLDSGVGIYRLYQPAFNSAFLYIMQSNNARTV